MKLVKRADNLMSSEKSGGKNDIRYEVVGRRETERSGMELSTDILRNKRETVLDIHHIRCRPYFGVAFLSVYEAFTSYCLRNSITTRSSSEHFGSVLEALLRGVCSCLFV